MDTTLDTAAPAPPPPAAAAFDPELVARVRLAATAGVAPRLAARLLARFGSAHATLAAGVPAWTGVPGVGAARAALLAAAPTPDEALHDLARAAAAGADALWPGDPRWPASLAELPDPPLVLYVRGTLPPLGPSAVAIVGSRRASAYGTTQARRLAAELVERGFVVVSGLARGIDAAAHRGALEAGGLTVGVLGGGLARFYPPEHVPLAREIVGGRGAVLSEFPLDVPPLPHHFPRRNRVLAALAAAVVVVEAGERSGSLVTADHALDLGREVLAVPGRVDHPNACGVHRLLREGAALCEGAADVLAALGADAPSPSEERNARDGAGAAAAPGATPDETAVLAALAGEERSADDVVDATGLEAGAALAALAALELAGRVTLRDDGLYALAVGRGGRP